MKRLKKNILIIDVFELERMILKVKKPRDLIRGKDVILVMGMTGSGKTTTILKFLGHNFKKTVINGFTGY